MPRFFYLVLLLLAPLSSMTSAGDTPNIILFLVDDLGWQDTSVQFGPQPTGFNSRYRTPAMEALADRGLLFTDAYSASPVCTPTRTSIMTGQSPGRSRISYWTLHPNRDTSKQHPRLKAPAWRMEGLQPDDLTMPQLLRDSGYRTIHAGKAHFGAVGTPGADPCNLGFDVNIAGHGPGGPGSYYGIHDFKARKRQGKDGDSVWDVPGLEKYHGQDIFLTEAITTEVVAAIEESAAMNKPFFVNFAPYAVHAPIMPNSRYLSSYKDIQQQEAAYATLIESMDAALNTLVSTLDRLELSRNTIIIFASDNGGLSAHARGGEPHIHNAPLRSGKGSAYEGGVRVPLIVAWPGVTDSGDRSNIPTISMDLFPTILDMANVEIPVAHQPLVDGESLVPLLKKEGVLPMDRPLLWHMPHQWGARGPGIEPFTSLRKGHWKCYYFHDGPRVELYDLADDLSETRNVAVENTDTVRELLMEMGACLEKTDSQLSIDITTGSEIIRPGVRTSRGNN